MTLDPDATLVMALVSVAGWLMMRAGLAKNGLELRRKRHVCPSCGRRDSCNCGA